MARRHLSPWLALAVLALAAVPPSGATHHRVDVVGDVYPTQSAPGVETFLLGYVWNGWPDAWGGAVDVEVYVDGGLLERVRVEGVEWGGAEFVTTASFVPEARAHALEIRVDVSDEAEETDESNNVLAYDLLFTDAPPDLETTVLATRAVGWPSTHAEIDVRLCNVGSGPTPGGTRVWGWLLRPSATSLAALGSGPANFDAATPPLAAGECVERTFAHDATNWVGNADYALHASMEFEAPFVFEPTYDNNFVDGHITFGPHLIAA